MRWLVPLAFLVAMSIGCAGVPEDSGKEKGLLPTLPGLTGLPGLPGGLPGQSGGSTLQSSTFSPNPGGLRMFTYVPEGMPAQGAPLVVALHGCTQSASQYALNTGWNKLADTYKFYVLYPEQNPDNNPVQCFNWAGEYGNPDNMIRGRGENRSIAAMVEKMKSTYGIDAKRVYITGFSAGAYMATVMLATYPELFAGGSIMAGGAYYCADDVQPAFDCMRDGKLHARGVAGQDSPEAWGKLVRERSQSDFWKAPNKLLPLMVWNGTSDTTVGPANQESLIKQWSNLFGIAATPTRTGTLKGQSVREYDKAGQVLIKAIKINGLNHSVAIDPGTNTDQGGTIGSYVKDVDLYAPYYTLVFFGLTSGTQPPPPPPTPVCKATCQSDADCKDCSGGKTTCGSAGQCEKADTPPPPPGPVCKATCQSDADCKDCSGGKNTCSSGQCVAPSTTDTEAPKLTFDSLSAYWNQAGKLLGKVNVELKGSASDNQSVARVELVFSTYQNACTGSLTKVKTEQATVGTGWHFALDTLTLENYKCYKIEATAFDQAGNASASVSRNLYILHGP